jgi:hypothetical protein
MMLFPALFLQDPRFEPDPPLHLPLHLKPPHLLPPRQPAQLGLNLALRVGRERLNRVPISGFSLIN